MHQDVVFYEKDDLIWVRSPDVNFMGLRNDEYMGPGTPDRNQTGITQYECEVYKTQNEEYFINKDPKTLEIKIYEIPVKILKDYMEKYNDFIYKIGTP